MSSGQGAVARRIVGLDAARGLAVIGMFFAHTVSAFAPGESIADGRSAILFATLAGMSIGLMTGGASIPPPDSRAPLRLTIVLRGLALVVLGLLLTLPDTYIAIILDYYGVMFLLVAPLLFVRRGVLIAIGLGLVVVGPLAALAFAPVAAGLDARGDELLVLPIDWVFTGHYPALTWLVFLIAGLVCARSDLRRRTTQVWMLGFGTAAAIVGYGAAAISPATIDASAHSGAPAEVVASGGFALAVTALLLIITGGSPGGRLARAVLWPVSAVGSMPLTVYTVQILLLAAVPLLDTSGSTAVVTYALPAFLALTALSLVGASLWRRFMGAGPLERLLSWATRARHPIERSTNPA